LGVERERERAREKIETIIGYSLLGRVSEREVQSGKANVIFF